MKPQWSTHSLVSTFAPTALSVLAPAAACTGSPLGRALPWDQPLNTVAALLTGPIAHTFVALALTVAFLIYAIQGRCEPARRLLQAGFTTAIAVEAVKLLKYLLPY